MKNLLALLLFAAFALPLMGQDEMPAYVLFRMISANTDPDSQTQFQAGWPIAVRKQNQYGGKQVLPMFGQLVITDATVQQIEDAYMIPWNKQIDWEFNSHDYPTDTHSLKIYIKPEFVSASGLNRLTRAQVEQWLNRWGATVDSVSQGEVNFTANVRNAIWSEGFWGHSTALVNFDEQAYDPVTGIHSMWADLSLIESMTEADLAAIIVNHGCVNVKKPKHKTFTFDCSRQTVFGEFKDSVKEALNGQFSVRRWRLNQTALDAIVAAGGSLEVTKGQLAPYLINRIDD